MEPVLSTPEKKKKTTVSMVTQMVVHSFELFNLRHFSQKHQASEDTSGLKREKYLSSLEHLS